MRSLPRKLRRYGLELLIVFLGVSLSLLAENWRQSRSDAASESASLARLYGDMQLDQQDMRANAARARVGLAAARSLIASTGTALSSDSVSNMLTGIGICSFFVPYTSEYTALQSSGRLSLITDDGIREGIVRLYEEQPFLGWLHERDCAMTSDLIDSLVGKFEFAEPAAQRRGTTRFPRILFEPGQGAQLRDPALQGQLVRLATQRQYLVDQIERRISSTEALRARIRVALGSDTTELSQLRGRPGPFRPQGNFPQEDSLQDSVARDSGAQSSRPRGR